MVLNTYMNVELNHRKLRLMKPTHDSLLLRVYSSDSSVSGLCTHQTVLTLSDECVSMKLLVTVNHVLVSLASPFYMCTYIYNYIYRVCFLM